MDVKFKNVRTNRFLRTSEHEHFAGGVFRIPSVSFHPRHKTNAASTRKQTTASFRNKPCLNFLVERIFFEPFRCQKLKKKKDQQTVAATRDQQKVSALPSIPSEPLRPSPPHDKQKKASIWTKGKGLDKKGAAILCRSSIYAVTN